MTSFHAHLVEIDRVWIEQVQYVDQQRNQRIQQSITAFLQTHRQSLQEAQSKIDDVEREKHHLQQKIQALEQTQPADPTHHKAGTVTTDDLLVDVHQLGLRLAQAWSIRAGTREEIQSQFRAKGLENRTIHRMCGTAGFWEDLDQQLSPRRSERLQVATDSSRSPYQGSG